MSFKIIFLSGFIAATGLSIESHSTTLNQNFGLSYLLVKSECRESGFVLDDHLDRDLPHNIVCNLISQDGDLLSSGDDHYRLIVDEVAQGEEDSWDELSLMFNQSVLNFGLGGSPDLIWDQIVVVNGRQSERPVALVFQRSFGWGANNKLIDPHYFVVCLDKESSCVISPQGSLRFQKTEAFSRFSEALSAVKNLESKKNLKSLCSQKAQPLS